MGKHAEWRKLAKKLRRKRIRQNKAKELEELKLQEQQRRESSPSYKQWCAEQEELELFKEQEEQRIAKDNEEQWLQREKEAQKQWQELQEKLSEIREERRKQEERIREEWKREQEKIQEIKEKNKREKEEIEKKQIQLKEKIEEFITHGGEIPEELLGTQETNPNKPACPFFSKTGACRFRDSCSRNHVKPISSNTLLIQSFYSHLCLEQSNDSEYGSDITLEYEDREMYNHFREFYYDILPEFEKYGRVETIKVCSNKELHLRGNVYVEYFNVREALKACQVFQGRWYGGKQLNVEFCNISSWKSAICGLNFNNKCPKGSACNFLHVFTNPERSRHTSSRNNSRNYKNRHKESESNRNWRWSESPERSIGEKENFNDKKNKRKSDDTHNDSKRSKHHKSSRSRSRSRSSSRSSSSRHCSDKRERLK